MTREETKKAIKVMQAYVDGKTIQYKEHTNKKVCWEDGEPLWIWEDFDYRVKPEQKYRPFANAREFRAAQKEHGIYLVLTNLEEYIIDFPVQITDKSFYMSDNEFSYEEALVDLTWEDGSPCGVLTNNNE